MSLNAQPPMEGKQTAVRIRCGALAQRTRLACEVSQMLQAETETALVEAASLLADHKEVLRDVKEHL